MRGSLLNQLVKEKKGNFCPCFVALILYVLSGKKKRDKNKWIWFLYKT